MNVLLSPDLLPQLFSSLGLSEHAAAGVCSTWSRAYSRQLRRCCYVKPGIVWKLAGVPELPNGLCVLPGGVLAIASYTGISQNVVKFVASAHPDTDPQALAACQASSLAAARRLAWPSGMALARQRRTIGVHHLVRLPHDRQLPALRDVQGCYGRIDG